MARNRVSGPIENLTHRVDRVEQILPTVATKKDLLAARNELRREIAEIVAPLATREEMHKAIAEEGERMRRYALVLHEQTRGDIQLLAEHILDVKARLPER